MHYGPFTFNKNESIPTVTTKIPEFFNVIGQYLDLSNMDTLKLNRVYNCCMYVSTGSILGCCIDSFLNFWIQSRENMIRFRMKGLLC